MLNRFAIVFFLVSVAFSGCKKRNHASSEPPLLSPNPPAVAPTPAPAPANTKPAVDQSAQVVIFGYHRFVAKVKRPDTEITPEAFEAQMKELKDRGIPVIPMQDFLAWKRGEKAIPPRAAVVTFDDGWKSQYEVGWPIMKKHGYPFTMFIYTEGVRPGHFSGGESMTWEQLAEMRDVGVDIQAHTQTHQDLRKPYDKVARKKLSSPEYDQWLQNEVIGSKEIIELKLAVKVNCFAVPYGLYNQHVKDIAMKAGYEAMFTVYGQPITYHTPLDSLGRYFPEMTKPKTFSDAVSAISSTATAGPAVAEVSIASLSPQPADGETVKNPMPLIKANLASMGPVEAASVQMRISGLGVVPSKYEAKTQIVSYQVAQKLREKSCTVILSAKAGEKKTETHWTFNIDQGGAAPVASATVPPPPLPSPAPAKKP
jgi:peptidoglycan/xylan/chitin deacetylase (PgdA/CDA1 family)